MKIQTGKRGRIGFLASLALLLQSAVATSPPPPDPFTAVLHLPGDSAPAPYYASMRVYQEGAAMVPYIVDLLPDEAALIDAVKNDPFISIPVYGPTICLTESILLNPIGASSYNYTEAEWSQLVSGSESLRILALNPLLEESLVSGDYYQSSAGWVESAVLGWIYAYGTTAVNAFSWGDWYYLQNRGNVYIVEGGMETVPHPTDANCPPDQFNTYYFWDDAEQTWYYFSAASPEWAYNFSFGVWMETRTPWAVPDWDYIGLTTQAALDLAASDNGRTARVIEIDGVGQIVTQDHSPMRLNFSTQDGLVIEVTRG